MPRYILYDYDADELATTYVYKDYDEAVCDANDLDNVLIIPIEVEPTDEPDSDRTPARTLTIADQHSSHDPANRLELPMEGGSPWYAYLWVDDKLFIATRDDTTGRVTIERRK